MNILEVNIIAIMLYAAIFLLLQRGKRKQFIVLTSLNLIIINGLRDSSVGVDTIRYERGFYLSITETFSELLNRRTEFGYNFLSKIVGEISGSFNLWLLIIAFFMFGVFGWFTYKYSKNVFISYLVFLALGFYGHTFNITRQMIAVMITLLSFPHLLKREFLKFSGIILFASLFHTTSIAFLPAYFVNSVKFKKKYLYWLIPLIFVIYRFRLQIANYLTTLIRPEYLGRYNISASAGGLSLGIIVLLVVGFVFNNPFKSNSSRMNIVLTKLMIIALMIQILSSYAYAFTRVNLYYLIYLTIYIPNVLTGFSKVSVGKSAKSTTMILVLINLTVIIFLLVYYNVVIHSDGPGIMPYKFFWQN